MRVRQYLRVPVKIEAKVKILEDSFSKEEILTIRNISFGGAFIESQFPYKPETLLEISFNLPGSDKEINITGFVCWSNKELNPPGMGIQFLTISNQDQKLLKQFIDDIGFIR